MLCCGPLAPFSWPTDFLAGKQAEAVAASWARKTPDNSSSASPVRAIDVCRCAVEGEGGGEGDGVMRRRDTG